MTEDVKAQSTAQDLLDHTRAEITLADNKASILLAGVLAVTGGISAALVASGWSLALEGRVTELLFWAAALCLTCSIVSLALVVYPRRVSSQDRKGPILAYFGDVASLSGPAALRAALVEGGADRMDVLIDQLWRISKIVVRKYLYLQLGMRLLAASFSLAVLTGVATTLS